MRISPRSFAMMAAALLAGCASSSAKPGHSSPAPVPAAAARAADGRVYEGREVERQPRLLNATNVQRVLSQNYPPMLRQAGVEGAVVLRGAVEVDGTVSEVEVVRSSSHYEMDLAAVTVARAMRFAPATIGGKRVRVYVTVPINFTLRKEDPAANPAEPSPRGDAARR